MNKEQLLPKILCSNCKFDECNGAYLQEKYLELVPKQEPASLSQVNRVLKRRICWKD